jgi:hypothetical protein
MQGIAKIILPIFCFALVEAYYSPSPGRDLNTVPCPLFKMMINEGKLPCETLGKCTQPEMEKFFVRIGMSKQVAPDFAYHPWQVLQAIGQGDKLDLFNMDHWPAFEHSLSTGILDCPTDFANCGLPENCTLVYEVQKNYNMSLGPEPSNYEPHFLCKPMPNSVCTRPNRTAFERFWKTCAEPQGYITNAHGSRLWKCDRELAKTGTIEAVNYCGGKKQLPGIFAIFLKLFGQPDVGKKAFSGPPIRKPNGEFARTKNGKKIHLIWHLLGGEDASRLSYADAERVYMYAKFPAGYTFPEEAPPQKDRIGYGTKDLAHVKPVDKTLRQNFLAAAVLSFLLAMSAFGAITNLGVNLLREGTVFVWSHPQYFRPVQKKMISSLTWKHWDNGKGHEQSHYIAFVMLLRSCAKKVHLPVEEALT